MAYKVIILYRLYMPSYFLGTFTEYPYLDVLSILVDKSFIYFTSNKSSILELCCWMGNHPNIGNPFNNAKKEEFNARMNYNSTYTDVMLYKKEFI